MRKTNPLVDFTSNLIFTLVAGFFFTAFTCLPIHPNEIVTWASTTIYSISLASYSFVIIRKPFKSDDFYADELDKFYSPAEITTITIIFLALAVILFGAMPVSYVKPELALIMTKSSLVVMVFSLLIIPALRVMGNGLKMLSDYIKNEHYTRKRNTNSTNIICLFLLSLSMMTANVFIANNLTKLIGLKNDTKSSKIFY